MVLISIKLHKVIIIISGKVSVVILSQNLSTCKIWSLVLRRGGLFGCGCVQVVEQCAKAWLVKAEGCGGAAP